MNAKMKSTLFSSIVLLILLSSHSTVGNFSAGISGNLNSQETNPYDYHSYDSMTQFLVNISEQYSDLIHLQSIGTTYEDRSIWMVKISDNPTQDENEPAVLLMGAHHGNEKPSYESLIFFIDYIVDTYYSEPLDDDQDGTLDEDDFDGIDNDNDGLIDEDPSEDRIRDIIDSTELFIIPMVNPDGVEYDWRKNRAPNYGSFGNADEITSYGVDLNRNYDYLWYLPYVLPLNYMLPLIINDQSWNYRGEHAFSEIETQSVRDFVLSHNNIEISLSYHTYSEIIFYPWMHTSLPTPDEETFISVGENISKIDGYDLRIHGWGDRDYIIPRFGGTIGSSENWLYGTQGIISYTMELCETRAPTNPEVVFDYCWKHVGVNLYVAERSHQLS